MTDKLIEQIKAEKEEGPVEGSVATVRSEYLHALEDRVLADVEVIQKAEAERDRLREAGDVVVDKVEAGFVSEAVTIWDNTRAALRREGDE